MGRKRELKVEISGDSTKATRALGDVADSGDKAQGRLGRAGTFMQGALDKIGLGGTKASAALEGVGNVAGGGLTAGAAAGGAAVAALGAVVVKGIGDFVGLAAEVRNFKQLSGASAEESSRFVAVLDDFGISSEAGANAIFKLGRGAEANKDKLAALGVEIARNKDGTVNLTETTLNVADAFAKTTDPAKRAELATLAFGKSGKDLIPVLEQGRKGLDEFFKGADNNFQLLTDEDLAKAREYELAMDALGDATSGLSREIGSTAAPAVADLANAIAEFITAADNALGSVGGLGTILDGVVKGPLLALGGPLGALAQGKDALDDLSGATDDTAEAQEKATVQTEKYEEATEDTAEAQRDAAKATKEQEKALDSLLKAQTGTIDADIRLENATRKLQDAKDDASEAFAATTAASGRDTEANRKNEEAVASLKSAMVDQAKASVAKAEADAAASGQALTAAQSNDIFKARLLELAATLAPGNALRAELEGYAAQIQSLPAAKATVLTALADTGPADASFRALEREFSGREIAIPVRFDMRQVEADFRQAERDFANSRAFQDAVTGVVQRYLQRGGRFV